MELVSERLSNIMGMAEFRYIIEKFGGNKRYPILSKYLPESNDGILPYDYAYQALDEILMLENQKIIGETTILNEKLTGNFIANSSTFINHQDKNYNFTVDKNGFYIIELIYKKDKGLLGKILFQSKNFIQQPISKNKYRFVDIETSSYYDTNSFIYPSETPKEQYEFEVKIENHSYVKNDYIYIS